MIYMIVIHIIVISLVRYFVCGIGILIVYFFCVGRTAPRHASLILFSQSYTYFSCVTHTFPNTSTTLLHIIHTFLRRHTFSTEPKKFASSPTRFSHLPHYSHVEHTFPVSLTSFLCCPHFSDSAHTFPVLPTLFQRHPRLLRVCRAVSLHKKDC